MFHLFSHCWSWLKAIQEPIRKVTLLVLGLDNAGKTSVIMDLERALAGEVLPAAQPGQTCLRVDRFEVTLVDLPGGQRSRSAWRSHYSTAHGLLFVLDSSDLARIEEARKVLSRVLSHPDVSGKPLLLLANKQDAAAALLPCELIERLSLERLVNENRSPCRIEPCAAKRGPPAGPGRATLQGLRWLLRAAPAAPAAATPPGPGPRAARGRPPARRDPPLPAEDARGGAGKTGEDRPLRPGRRLPPPEESTKGPGRRKRKVKVKKKGLGQPSPDEGPEGPRGGGDSQASAARGLLPHNSVGQEEPTATRMAAPHPVQGMKKKKKKKIKNKIKSQEPAAEQQREEVSSTFGWYFPGQILLKSTGRSGLLASRCELCRSPWPWGA
ncbi:ADP-ribosylation factor-like protein 13A isoform X1 [Falco biarmicus]|uniref:ADP-ribosylation factor-like protein 13A isoform X1 n=1 Tax=Falco cherrug TaxID=345164 RepID=UPI00247AB7F7|nr:ADP-ribosylation factor-like protein 13A isoform X1 [Falco cherrug]XP_055583820.1 ADP-ribosylation factor-like protein 13A isoform X1 [Falco cherrug]XP_055583821.1 ADP-ribosylation factor-like protein 13A isoform X1 [Falco cherrug]XP_056216181.1 ADP-ribosylation factor-like protein 13A isoform X1 [Falco biarmicus]XP_056216182.1 ADP-ribosylation factor-like protein 13A isoform X1 [Falco biarmicus]XP_056216183.1 ADP-ribosylation factor-like protein 13A isoform X1 [Falco biarmicus]